MDERRIRKGDTVKLKPGVFLLQREGETAQVEHVYKYKAYVKPPLNNNSYLYVSSLVRVAKETRITRKSFRDHLNALHSQANHRHGKYRQTKRQYGDYLYFQDREKFEVEFAEYIKSKAEPVTTKESVNCNG